MRPGSVRHLLYHCCPLVTNDLWMRNVDQLCDRIGLFNGRLCVAVSIPGVVIAETGRPEAMCTMDEVRQYFGERCHRTDEIEFVPVKNDHRLREVASFQTLLDRVATPKEGHATFYAHTKGNSTYGSVQGSIYWRNAMYYALLDQWESCMDHLREHVAAGCCKMVWGDRYRSPYPSGLNHGRWMFSGTFFWFRNDMVFSREDWRKVPNDRYGAEAWLAGMFEHEQVKSVMQPWPETAYPGVDPYDPDWYRDANVAIEDIELTHPSYRI